MADSDNVIDPHALLAGFLVELLASSMKPSLLLVSHEIADAVGWVQVMENNDKGDHFLLGMKVQFEKSNVLEIHTDNGGKILSESIYEVFEDDEGDMMLRVIEA